MPFYDPATLKSKEIAPGAWIKPLWGEKVMMSLVEVAPGAVMPLHSHPHEQTGIMMQGEFEMTIGGETRVLRPGDAYVIPGGIEHGVRGSDGWALALDIFSPPREDYKVTDQT